MSTWTKAIIAAAALLTAVSGLSSARPDDGPAGDLPASLEAFDRRDWDRALRLTGGPFENPWLEGYRLGARACSSIELGDTVSSLAYARIFSALSHGGRPLFGHPFFRPVADILVMTGNHGTLPGEPAVYPDGALSSHSLIRLAIFRSGKDGAGEWAALVDRACEAGIDSAAAATAAERALADSLFGLSLSPPCLGKVGRSLVSAGRLDLASAIADIAGSRPEGRGEALLLRARILERSRSRRAALALYRGAFDDDGLSVDTRKRALAGAASLLYGMKEYQGSARIYKRLGEMYAGEPEGETALDMAARIELSRGRYEEAVQIWRGMAAAGPVSERGREALLGCAAAMSLDGDDAGALKVLRRLLESGAGSYEPAALYWTARTAGPDAGDAADLLLERHPRSVYAEAVRRGNGFLLAGRNAEGTGSALEGAGMRQRERLAACLESSGGPPAGFPSHPAFGAYEFFLRYGDMRRTRECAEFLARSGLLPDDRATALALEAASAGIPVLGLGLPVYGSGGICAIDLLYPLVHEDLIAIESERREVPAEMVLAVVREESAFDPSAVSPAGATGLMQIMPSTGEWASGRTRTKYEGPGTLFDPGFSIEAGTWYLGFLLDRSSDSLVAALASYNAGHGRMSDWKRKYRPHEDPLLALELIGPAETRGYVRKALDSILAYRVLIYD